MADNVLTSTTAVAAAVTTDTVFSVTYPTYNHGEGVIFYIKWTAGTTTAVSITFATIVPILSSTVNYNTISLSGSTVVKTTYILAAAGNYRIPVPLAQAEQTVVATVTVTATGGTGVLVCDFIDN